MSEEKIGVIEDYFSHVSVAALTLENQGIRIGDNIRIKGHTTDIEFTVDSMQIEHDKVEQAKVGDSVGIKVPERVRRKDIVYKVT